MKLRLICVGKPRDDSLARLHDRYAERLAALGVQYRTDWVPDVAAGGRYSDEHVREREARAILDRLASDGTRSGCVALDPGGRLFTSEKLARRLESRTRPLALVVGGPLGLSRTLVDRADWTWSLSPLTFPHEMVRLLVVEQLYRAATILRGLPYHK